LKKKNLFKKKKEDKGTYYLWDIWEDTNLKIFALRKFLFYI
jgi:hypothetical protein